MSKYNKFDQFHSEELAANNKQSQRLVVGKSEDRINRQEPNSVQLLNRERRSFSIERTLKLIKEKEDINTRVVDYLTNKKIGLVAEEQTKYLKQFKNYNEGNRTKEETLVFLKQLKKEQDVYTSNTKLLFEQIYKLQSGIAKLKYKIQQYNEQARFTYERSKLLETQHEEMSSTTATATYQNKVLINMVDRSKYQNGWLRAKVLELRNLIKSKNIYLDSLGRSVAENLKKDAEEQVAAVNFDETLRQSSIELYNSFKVAQETILSKAELLKAMSDNNELKEQAAREYEMKYMSDTKLWSKLRAHQFYKLILNHSYIELQEKSAPLEHAFGVVKMRTAIKYPLVFLSSTYEYLKQRQKILEYKQNIEEARNRSLIKYYEYLVLSMESKDGGQGGSYAEERSVVPLREYEHIDHARDTHSRISLWTSRMQWKLKSLIHKRTRVEPDKTKNELLIRIFLEVLQDRLLNI